MASLRGRDRGVMVRSVRDETRHVVKVQCEPESERYIFIINAGEMKKNHR